MAKYEVWGPDESGKSIILAYGNGDLPSAGDTIGVRGHERDIEKVFKHHVGSQFTYRLKVGQPLGISDSEASGSP